MASYGVKFTGLSEQYLEFSSPSDQGTDIFDYYVEMQFGSSSAPDSDTINIFDGRDSSTSGDGIFVYYTYSTGLISCNFNGITFDSTAIDDLIFDGNFHKFGLSRADDDNASITLDDDEIGTTALLAATSISTTDNIKIGGISVAATVSECRLNGSDDTDIIYFSSINDSNQIFASNGTDYVTMLSDSVWRTLETNWSWQTIQKSKSVQFTSKETMSRDIWSCVRYKKSNLPYVSQIGEDATEISGYMGTRLETVEVEETDPALLSVITNWQYPLTMTIAGATNHLAFNGEAERIAAYNSAPRWSTGESIIYYRSSEWSVSDDTTFSSDEYRMESGGPEGTYTTPADSSESLTVTDNEDYPFDSGDQWVAVGTRNGYNYYKISGDFSAKIYVLYYRDGTSKWCCARFDYDDVIDNEFANDPGTSSYYFIANATGTDITAVTLSPGGYLSSMGSIYFRSRALENTLICTDDTETPLQIGLGWYLQTQTWQLQSPYSEDV